MIYTLTEDQKQSLNSSTYWIEDNEARTSLVFLTSIRKHQPDVVTDDFYNEVAKWTEDNSYLIYDYTLEPFVDAHALPKQVIFPQQLTQNLYKSYELLYGDKTNVTYYADYTPEGEVLSKPIVKIDYVYHRDEYHYIKCIERKFSWMLKSGNWSEDTYNDLKVFSHLRDKLKELAMVRNNIIDEAQGLAKQMGLLSQMLGIYADFESEVTQYEKAGSRALSNAILNAPSDTYSWLDVPTSDGLTTIRLFLSSFFAIGVIDAETF